MSSNGRRNKDGQWYEEERMMENTTTTTATTSSSSSSSHENQSPSGGCRFECNICLDIVKDPVVTRCGHLYCWSCLYKWLEPGLTPLERHQLHLPTSTTIISSEQQSRRSCPVCKAKCQLDLIIPIYVKDSQSQLRQRRTSTVPLRPIPPPRRESPSSLHPLLQPSTTETLHQSLFQAFLGLQQQQQQQQLTEEHSSYFLSRLLLMLFWFVILCLLLF